VCWLVFRILGKTLAAADFIAIILILFSPLFSYDVLLIGAFFLIFKGGFFFLLSGGGFVNGMDMFCGMYLLLLAVGLSFSLVTLVSVLFLGQKVLMGFLV